MATFTVHTKETVSEEGQDILAKVEENYGFIPNLLGVLVEAPIAAEAYFHLIQGLYRSSLTPTERHVVWFAINYEHECEYCMAAHTAIAKMEEIPEEVIEATRNGSVYSDNRLEHLRKFTQSIVVNRGEISTEEVDQFLEQDFTKQNVLEIVTAVASKVLSNYTNHIAKTPLDEAFAACAWKK